jgi:hypothetical protein
MVRAAAAVQREWHFSIRASDCNRAFNSHHSLVTP